MKTIYLDSEYKCHVQAQDGFTSVETDTFDGKCDAYIEGYRYVPAGESWTREDGTVFHGGMIAPCRDYNILMEFQAQHESMQAEMEEKTQALEILGVIT